MDSRKFVLRQTLLIAIGQIVGVGVMLGVFALLGRLDYTVVLGGLIGALVALLNFFFMAVSLSLAADRAVQQDAKGGKSLVKLGCTAKEVKETVADITAKFPLYK